MNSKLYICYIKIVNDFSASGLLGRSSSFKNFYCILLKNNYVSYRPKYVNSLGCGQGHTKIITVISNLTTTTTEFYICSRGQIFWDMPIVLHPTNYPTHFFK
jgi:hypothetical protein